MMVLVTLIRHLEYLYRKSLSVALCRLCHLAHHQTDDRYPGGELLSCDCLPSIESFAADNRQTVILASNNCRGPVH
jgi:hypothetical protein